MKINAKYIKHLYNQRGQAEVSLLISNFRQCGYLNELDTSNDYIVEIKQVKSKRSINQNNYLWAMLNELEKASDQDMMSWYIHALEESDSKHEYLMGIEGLSSTLTKSFRAVKEVGKRELNGKEVIVYKCFYGSSKFTIAEMNQLLDTVLRYCAEYNIDTEVLK